MIKYMRKWKKKETNNTRCSQAVTHPSTNHARRSLTLVIEREPVVPTWYGRWRLFNLSLSRNISFTVNLWNTKMFGIIIRFTSNRIDINNIIVQYIFITKFVKFKEWKRIYNIWDSIENDKNKYILIKYMRR